MQAHKQAALTWLCHISAHTATKCGLLSWVDVSEHTDLFHVIIFIHHHQHRNFIKCIQIQKKSKPRDDS